MTTTRSRPAPPARPPVPPRARVAGIAAFVIVVLAVTAAVLVVGLGDGDTGAEPTTVPTTVAPTTVATTTGTTPGPSAGGISRFPLPVAPLGPVPGQMAGAADGSLWIAVADSDTLVRFDGLRWQWIRPEDGILAGTMMAVTAGPDGSVWVLQSTGVSRFADGAWTSYRTADIVASLDLPRPSTPMTAITAAPDGSVWAAGPAGLFHFDGEAWTGHRQAFGMEPGSIGIGPDGRVWVGGGAGAWQAGLVEWDGTTWSRHPFQPGALPADLRYHARVDSERPPGELTVHGATSLAVAADGSVWQALWGGVSSPGGFYVTGAGVVRYDPQSWVTWTYAGDDVFDRGLPSLIAGAPDGTLVASSPGTWVSRTEAGLGWGDADLVGGALYRYDGSTWSTLLEGEGGMTALTVAANGAVWAVSGDELVRIVP